MQTFNLSLKWSLSQNCWSIHSSLIVVWNYWFFSFIQRKTLFCAACNSFELYEYSFFFSQISWLKSYTFRFTNLWNKKKLHITYVNYLRYKVKLSQFSYVLLLIYITSRLYLARTIVKSTSNNNNNPLKFYRRNQTRSHHPVRE